MDKKRTCLIQEYKIGEVAEMFGTTIRTIRYYQEEGLLQPPRTEGGTRLYRESHLRRLKAILHLVQNEFSLEAIRVIATARDSCRSGDESSQAVASLLEHGAELLAERIAELETLHAEFLHAKALVGKCRGCRNRPTNAGCPECPVKKHAGEEELLSLIWEQEPDARVLQQSVQGATTDVLIEGCLGLL